MSSQAGIGLLLAGDNVARGSTPRFEFVHAASLNLGRLLAGLFHFEPHGVTALQAEQVGQAR
jgi:hypothetical protein